MRSSFLRDAAPWCAAFGFAVLISAVAPACGQQGVVAAGGSATTNSSGGGGSGGAAGGDTGGATAGAGGGEPIKILNWNLHNFFDKKKDTSSMYEQVLSATDYNKKVGQVGSVIAAMDPDIGIFPETENVGIVDDLNSKQLKGAYKTACPETNDFRGLDIGILSKVPIDKVVSHTTDMFKRLDVAGGKSYSYSRDAVEVHFTIGKRKLVVLGVHYRSKGDGSVETDDKDKRAAEAQHTRTIADALAKADPTLAILILGDFNDVPGSVPVAWTLAGDPMNNPKVTFLEAADNIAAADRYSFVYQGKQELIDHQMVSPVLAKMLDKSSVIIRHGQDVNDASDHQPMMATYDIQ